MEESSSFRYVVIVFCDVRVLRRRKKVVLLTSDVLRSVWCLQNMLPFVIIVVTHEKDNIFGKETSF